MWYWGWREGELCWCLSTYYNCSDIISRYSRLHIYVFRNSYEVYNVNQTYVTVPRRLSACTKVLISWIYDTRVLYDAHFFLQRSLIYTAKLKGVKRNMLMLIKKAHGANGLNSAHAIKLVGGGGMHIRQRSCTSGTCVGDSIETASCSDHQCPSTYGIFFRIMYTLWESVRLEIWYI